MTDLAVHRAAGGGIENATINELQRRIKVVGEVLGSAAVIGKGSDCRKGVLVAQESAKACLHPPDGDQGSCGDTKGVLDRDKKRSIGSLKHLPSAAIAAAPRFAMKASSDSMKLFWLRSAAMVPDE